MTHLAVPALRGAERSFEAPRIFAARHAFWYGFAAVMAVTAWNTLWRLGETFVRDCDEARYGVAASEMLHAHSMLVTTYAGATEFWNLKPPLGYWLLELSYRLFGETSFALRLPAAACALLSTAITMLLAHRVGGKRLALLAGLVLATAFGFLAHHGARSGELDSELTLILLLFLALASRLPDSRSARLAAGLTLGLGFLLKSFVILPFIAAVAIHHLLRRGVGSWRLWPIPLGIASTIAATWAIARSVSEGSREFVRRMFLEDLLLRSTTMIDPGVSGEPWDYAAALLDRFAPWPIIVLLAWALARRAFRQRLGERGALLWAYALVPLVLFTLARTHHSHYIVPTYPAWAILASSGAIALVTSAAPGRAAATTAALIGVCLLACQLRVFAQIHLRDRLSPGQHFLASLPAHVAGPERRLRTSFTPSYSERFFLQVVDGFSLMEQSQASGSDWMLIRKSGRGWADAAGPFAGELIAEDHDYALVRGMHEAAASRSAGGPEAVQTHE